MTNRTRILLAALTATLAAGLSSAALADRDRWEGRGHGWGHEKHARWQHQHRYYDPAPYGHVVIQTAPQVIYAPPAYYDGGYYDSGYYYRPQGYAPRYVYPVSPSISFGMTIPLD